MLFWGELPLIEDDAVAELVNTFHLAISYEKMECQEEQDNAVLLRNLSMNLARACRKSLGFDDLKLEANWNGRELQRVVCYVAGFGSVFSDFAQGWFTGNTREERGGLVRVANPALIASPSAGDGCAGPESQHALVPRLDGEPVGFLATLLPPALPPPGSIRRKCFRVNLVTIAHQSGSPVATQIALGLVAGNCLNPGELWLWIIAPTARHVP